MIVKAAKHVVIWSHTIYLHRMEQKLFLFSMTHCMRCSTMQFCNTHVAIIDRMRPNRIVYIGLKVHVYVTILYYELLTIFWQLSLTSVSKLMTAVQMHSNHTGLLTSSPSKDLMVSCTSTSASVLKSCPLSFVFSSPFFSSNTIRSQNNSTSLHCRTMHDCPALRQQ